VCSVVLGVMQEHQAPALCAAEAIRNALVVHTDETIAFARGAALK